MHPLSFLKGISRFSFLTGISTFPPRKNYVFGKAPKSYFGARRTARFADGKCPTDLGIEKCKISEASGSRLQRGEKSARSTELSSMGAIHSP